MPQIIGRRHDVQQVGRTFRHIGTYRVLGLVRGLALQSCRRPRTADLDGRRWQATNPLRVRPLHHFCLRQMLAQHHEHPQSTHTTDDSDQERETAR